MTDTDAAADRLDFGRRLYATTIDWYRNADTKAQVLLTLNGALLAFFTNALVRSPAELDDILDQFGPETFVAAAGMFLCTATSILAAVDCLHSRLGLRRLAAGRASDDPGNLLYFAAIAVDAERFRRSFHTFDAEVEVEALAAQIPALAENVVAKHRMVNIGFLAFGASLCLFILLALSYLLRAH